MPIFLIYKYLFIKVSKDYSKEVVNILKDGIYYEGTVVEKLEKLNEIDTTSKEYKDIISVGEYLS